MLRQAMAPTVVVLAVSAISLVPSDIVQATSPTVRVTAVGDYAALNSTSLVLNAIRNAQPDAHFALGDLSYGSTGAEQTWCNFVIARVGAGFPFELISGNHESNGINGQIESFAQCLPNRLPGLVGTYGRQYYVDLPQGDPTMRLVMISPGLTFPDGFWSYNVGSARYQWTAAAIDGARAAGIPWVVVGMHIPCLSVGKHQCESGADVANLMLQKKVDLVLAGHEHFYARSKQLALRTGCTSLAVDTYDADCVIDSDNSLVQGAGSVFVTVGTGGVNLLDVHLDDTERPYFAQLMGSNTASPGFGFLDLVATDSALTTRFVPATGSYTDTFTVTRPGGANQPPTAAVPSVSCSQLTCTFTDGGSSDPDGVIVRYAWTFGDGGQATGVSAGHTYGSAGTYPVVLTVTDDDGATRTAGVSVTVPATTTPFGADAFSRTVSSGWGTADVGGAWTVGPVAQGSVSGGAGRLLMPAAGAGPGAYLTGPKSSNTDLTGRVSVDKAASGSGTYVWLRGRRVLTGADYRAKLWWRAGNELRLSLSRGDASSAETAIGGSVSLAGGVTPGEQLKFRMQVTGTSPTTLRAKVWRVGQSEPSAWAVSATDSTAALQAPGYVGVTTYLSGSATNAPVTVSVDDWRAATP